MGFFKKEIIWHKLFENADAANNFLAQGRVTYLQIQNHKICLAHTADGFFAVNDKCPHNGASLSSGKCTSDGAIVCPVHRYAFDLKTGRSKGGLGSYVERYPIESRSDGIYIGFEKVRFFLF